MIQDHPMSPVYKAVRDLDAAQVATVLRVIQTMLDLRDSHLQGIRGRTMEIRMIDHPNTWGLHMVRRESVTR